MNAATSKPSQPASGQLFYGDNLDVLRESIASESVDLVYLDPPFNSNATYAAPPCARPRLPRLGAPPAPQRDQCPHRLHQPERPRALQEPVGRAEQT